ncbi:MAG: hypothetical protein WA944_19455 [Mycobacterium sp.]
MNSDIYPFADHVAAVVALAPPLTEERRARITALLRRASEGWGAGQYAYETPGRKACH